MAFSSSSSENNFRRTSRLVDELEDAEPSTFAEHQRRSRRQQGTSQGFNFDIFAWYPKHQSCQKYFLDHAQHEVLVQAFASFINILLPFQREPNPVYNSKGARTAAERMEHLNVTKPFSANEMTAVPVSLVPYIRRLVATGMDVEQILHGFFGDDWPDGIGPQREQERRNYLFAAKSGGWASVKRDYDMLPLETVPFLRPLTSPTNGEIEAAEKSWSEWLALEDWMVGPRAPDQT